MYSNETKALHLYFKFVKQGTFSPLYIFCALQPQALLSALVASRGLKKDFPEASLTLNSVPIKASAFGNEYDYKSSMLTCIDICDPFSSICRKAAVNSSSREIC